MNKDRNIWIIVSVAAAVLLVAYLVLRKPDKKKFDWYETYKVHSKEPFGTSFIYQMLESQHRDTKIADKQPLRKVIGDTSVYNTGNNYVFIGAYMYLNPEDRQAIIDFVARGNNAFIACKEIPEDLMETVYAGECDKWTQYRAYRDSAVELNFFHPRLRTTQGYKFEHRVNDELSNYNWECINGSYFCDSSTSFAEIGYIDSFYANFAELPFGKGKFYLHTTPFVFSNYCMKDTTGLAYADVVFSHLNNGPVIWDEYSKLYKFTTSSGSGSGDNSTPLSYILSQKSLRYAWYLLLLGAILYLVFMARRRQRIIDVIEPNTNTSLSYISTISALYFNHANHIAIAHHKMRYFLTFVRNRYNLTVHVDDQVQITKLAQKSKVSVGDIDKILVLYARISKSFEIGEATLIEFHYALENFYNNCN